MQLQQAFDATNVDPTQGAGQLPVGKHPVIISESEITATKDQESGMVVLTLQIIDGPSKGQNGDYRLNLYNKSQKASEIAQRQLSAICHVTGVFKVTDTRQLHNIPFVIEVGLQKDPESASKGYTQVTRVFDINGNEPGNAPVGAQGGSGNGGNAWGGGSNNQQPPAQQQQPTGSQWGGGAGNNQQGNNNGGNAWGGGNAGGGNAAGTEQQNQKPAWAK